ncbi:hypothetical protein GCM10028808_50520 [Spirosoma migulaei]
MFEGFFDFLSALTYKKQLRPECTTIILNSTTNLAQALPGLEGAKRIHTYSITIGQDVRPMGNYEAQIFPSMTASVYTQTTTISMIG